MEPCPCATGGCYGLSGDPWRGKVFAGIRLKTRWLLKAGFCPGQRVTVTISSGGRDCVAGAAPAGEGVACDGLWNQGEHTNYMMGELFASQVHHAICRGLFHGTPPAAVSYVGSHAVGDFLRHRVFNPGRTLDWRELTRLATGEDLNPKAFAADLEASALHGLRK